MTPSIAHSKMIEHSTMSANAAKPKEAAGVFQLLLSNVKQTGSSGQDTASKVNHSDGEGNITRSASGTSNAMVLEETKQMVLALRNVLRQILDGMKTEGNEKKEMPSMDGDLMPSVQWEQLEAQLSGLLQQLQQLMQLRPDSENGESTLLSFMAENVKILYSQAVHSETQSFVELSTSVRQTLNALSQWLHTNGQSMTSANNAPIQSQRHINGYVDHVLTERHQTSENRQAGKTGGNEKPSFAQGNFDMKKTADSIFRRAFSNPPTRKESVPGSQSFLPGPMNRLQQYALHVRDGADSVSKDQWIREIQKVLTHGRLTNSAGKQQLSIQLYPRHLGKLNIQLTRVDGQLTATLVTSTPAAKTLVESHLHQLQNAFVSQNLHVSKLQVSMPFHQLPGQQQEFDQEHGHERDQQDSQQGERHKDDERERSDAGFLAWVEQFHADLDKEVNA
ncbi:MAG TPA: flagellar hook-length control protein FliK [Bacillales bacterium]|nr:flagellar hook-length control protein FliK [Bacillales bacterium]